MGQAQGAEDGRGRFATCEIEALQAKFHHLAQEGSFRGKTVDLKTFKKYICTESPAISEAFFKALDMTNAGKIEFDIFLKGLSYCLRGSFDEKLTFIFVMFCRGKKNKVGTDDFKKTISSSLFYTGKEDKSQKQKRVDALTQAIFKTYDKNKDQHLDKNEFIAWAKQSFEVTVILDLFKKLDNDLTVSTSGISGPTDVSHVSHVGKTEGGGLTIDNIPPAWLQLFKEAGVKKKELEDPQTCMMLMTIVAEKLNEKKPVAPAAPAPVANNPPPQPARTQPPEPNRQTKPDVKVNNPAPTVAGPPPPPPPPLPAMGGGGGNTNNAPAAPAPPIAAPAAPSLPTPAPVSSGGAADLLTQIRGGVSLKKMDETNSTQTSLNTLTRDDKNDLTNILSRAIMEHRRNLKEEEEQADEDDWD